MTKGEAAKLVLGDATWDSALPQPWVDEVARQTGYSFGDVCGAFVWAYDKQAGFGGRPCALTAKGNAILGKLNELARAVKAPELHILTEVPVDRMPVGLAMIAEDLAGWFRFTAVEDIPKVIEVVRETAREHLGAGLLLSTMVAECLMGGGGSHGLGLAGQWREALEKGL